MSKALGQCLGIDVFQSQLSSAHPDSAIDVETDSSGRYRPALLARINVGRHYSSYREAVAEMPIGHCPGFADDSWQAGSVDKLIGRAVVRVLRHMLLVSYQDGVGEHAAVLRDAHPAWA